MLFANWKGKLSSSENHACCGLIGRLVTPSAVRLFFVALCNFKRLPGVSLVQLRLANVSHKTYVPGARSRVSRPQVCGSLQQLIIMPLEADDQQKVDDAIQEIGADPSGTQVLVYNPTRSQKLGPFSVGCTILNRTIGMSILRSVCQRLSVDRPGSGIFVSPAIVLKTTGSVGVSLLLWTLGAVVGMSALFIWLELGLSVPKFELVNREGTETSRHGEESLQCVPRNGGEKNYVSSFIPRATQTCWF